MLLTGLLMPVIVWRASRGLAGLGWPYSHGICLLVWDGEGIWVTWLASSSRLACASSLNGFRVPRERAETRKVSSSLRLELAHCLFF